MWFSPQDLPWFVWLVSGMLLALGVLIALPDRLTVTITEQDNLGWILFAAGAALLIFFFLLPLWPAVVAAVQALYSGFKLSMLLAIVGAAVLISVGLWFRARP